MNSSFNLGFITIHYYSLTLLLGIILGSYIVIREARKKNLSEDFITNLLFYTVIFGIIGARIYFVLFNLDYYLSYPIEILEVWKGGLAIHGGMIGGLLTIIIYSHKYDVNSIKVLDMLVVGLIIARAIGRWGNFFNGEAHGPETTLAYLQSLYLPSFIIDGMNINGTYYIPTFFYESIWCIIGFIILIMVRKLKNIKVGQILSLYLIWYGIGRFFIEGMRTDSLMLLNIKMAQLVSLSMVIIGIILFIIMHRKKIFYNEVK